MLIPSANPNPGERRDAVLVRSLRQWKDDDLIFTVGAAATILGLRWGMEEGAVMEKLTELAQLQDAAEKAALRQAATS